MADQIEEGEITDVMVKESGKDRDRPRSKSNNHSRSRDSDRRLSKEYDGKNAEPSIKKSYHPKSEASKPSAGTPVKDAGSSSGSNKSSSGEPKSPVVMLDKKEIYESVIKYEAQLAAESDVDVEAKEFLETSEEFQEVLNDIHTLKASGTYDENEMDELKTEGLLLLGKLRHLNRISKLRLKLVKDDALSQRQEVDRNHLLLQNLLYEATHLNKQVEAVQEYKGQDEEIDLIPVKKFYEEAPPSIAKPELTRTNEHLLRIARLEHEFILRQELTNTCAELEKAKEKVAASIEMSKKRLESIRPLLQAVLESTKPVQEFFGMNLVKEQKELQISHYLPVPLYVLFVQSSAYKDAFKLNGGVFSVKICGDVDAAKDYVEEHEEEEQPEEESESDMECDDNVYDVEEVSDRRKSRKGSTARAASLNPRKKLVQTHPLWVEWDMKITSGESIKINFTYASKLQVVTVKATIESGVFADRLPSLLGQPDTILTGLFPDDTGMECPNPTSYYYIHKADVEHFSELVGELGRPYMWAQKVAGLNFPPMLKTISEGAQDQALTQKVEPSLKYSSVKMEKTVKLILERLKNQAKLWTQIRAIESKNLAIPVVARHLFPPKISTSFVSWESIPWGDTDSPAIQLSRTILQDKKIPASLDQKDMFFKAVVERGRVKLNAYILLGMGFPTIPPVFTLELEKDGENINSTDDYTLQELEKEINVHAPQDYQQWPEHLLLLQIQRMMVSMDIFLETGNAAGETSGPSEFGREKLFSSSTRGRNLRRPLEFKTTGAGHFTQRY